MDVRVTLAEDLDESYTLLSETKRSDKTKYVKLLFTLLVVMFTIGGIVHIMKSGSNMTKQASKMEISTLETAVGLEASITYELVANKKECSGSEEWAGRFSYLNDCAIACKGKSSMFVFGTNVYGTIRCNAAGCGCYCETAADADTATCSQSNHAGYNLYRYAEAPHQSYSNYELVADKKECGGSEFSPGRYNTVDECATACRGMSSMFIFGTNQWGKQRCFSDGCACYCETSADAATRTCNQIAHIGFRLYKYVPESIEATVDTDSDDMTTIDILSNDLTDTALESIEESNQVNCGYNVVMDSCDLCPSQRDGIEGFGCHGDCNWNYVTSMCELSTNSDNGGQIAVTGNECADNYHECQNGGIAAADVSGSSCVCLCSQAYKGEHCEIEKTCANDYCQNSGVGSGTWGGCTCVCSQDFKGSTCETEKTCANDYCQNGGVGSGTWGSCTCACPEGYSGSICDTRAPVSCEAVSRSFLGCGDGNESLWAVDSGACTCDCQPYPHGPRCETNTKLKVRMCDPRDSADEWTVLNNQIPDLKASWLADEGSLRGPIELYRQLYATRSTQTIVVWCHTTTDNLSNKASAYSRAMYDYRLAQVHMAVFMQRIYFDRLLKFLKPKLSESVANQITSDLAEVKSKELDLITETTREDSIRKNFVCQKILIKIIKQFQAYFATTDVTSNKWFKLNKTQLEWAEQFYRRMDEKNFVDERNFVRLVLAQILWIDNLASMDKHKYETHLAI